MIADAQALTDHFKDPGKVKENVIEVMCDYLAIGLDPEKSTLFIQSEVAAIPELAMYYLNLVTWNRLKHNPTVKLEIKQKGFGESVPAGFMAYPIFQAADITAFGAALVPVGEDQKPMIEQTTEIVRRFNELYGEVLTVPKAYIPSMGRLPGIDGQSKMSKSLNNAIYLSDSFEEMEKKVKRMYTDPGHLRVEDPGKVEGNPVFIYLDAFGEDKETIQEMKEHYQRGGLGDMVVKKYLIEVLETFLSPIRERRKAFQEDPSEVMRLLQKGGEKASITASETLQCVKKAMGIRYF